ncbi:MAG: NAD(+) synthase, partial [Patescibacteria group bacterium]
KLYDQGVQYALCPELGLTGYSCGDLFHQDTLLKSALRAFEMLVSWSDEHPAMMFSVGMPLMVDGMVFNCGVTMAGGKILGVAPKSYPPEYREFYELRHFARAVEARSKEISIGRQRNIPFGNDLLIRWAEVPSFALHLEVCEDLWVPIPPSAKAALAGATVLANLSASNITINKSSYRKMLVESSSGKNLAVQLYAAAGRGESTTDLAWDGDGYIAERGTVIARTERFADGGTHIVVDVDLEVLLLDRARQSSFRQNASDHRFAFRNEVFYGALKPAKNGHPAGIHETFLRSIDPHPFVPSDTEVRDERCRETFMIQATSLAHRLESLPESMWKVVIGVSGGQDSTHALLVVAYTMDLMKLPRTNIIAVTMPGFGTTGRTYRNALKLIRSVGATRFTRPVKTIAKALFRAAGYDPASDKGKEKALVFQNAQAWARKMIELAIACHKGAIVLGTGDLSELALGWCTMFGDHASHYGVNSGVPKTLISYLISWASDVVFKGDKKLQRCLRDILATPISPELEMAAEDGTIVQMTEQEIGPYELHDFTMYYLLRFGFSPSRICRMALHAFDGKYTIDEIKKWMRVFITRFFQTQVKRSCLPDGPKVGLVCVSPRGDWRMPSDALSDAWLRDLDMVPDQI